MRFVSLIFGIGLLAITSVAQATEYCVRDLPDFVPPVESVPGKNVISNSGGNIEPRWWRFDQAGKLLYAQGNGTVESNDGKQENRSFIWKAEEFPQLGKPFRVGYFGGIRDNRQMATDGLGRTLYINGSFAEGKNAVYEIGPDFQPILLVVPSNKALPGRMIFTGVTV